MWEQPHKSRPSVHARRKPRVLFFAEAVTLAHVARPVALAQSLPADEYEVHLACDDRYAALFPDLDVTTHPLHTIPSSQFLRAIARGTPIYSVAELERYIEHDQRLIAQLKPDVIVGDLRLSLSVSAAKAGIPHLAIANAYWSPFSRADYPMPDHPMNRIVGRRLAGWFFRHLRPFIFAQHVKPINRLRVRHGLPTLGDDLRHVYTHGDQTLYADISSMSGLDGLPDHHRFIGPIHWSPRIALPDWWDRLPQDKPIVYLNLGSSGHSHRLPALIDALSPLDITLIAATAGAPLPGTSRPNVFLAKYLPGDAACRLASLVICNGGSPSTQQALLAGRPVLGLPANMDQHLNMQLVVRSGAGRALLSEQCDALSVQDTVRTMLKDATLAACAGQIADQMRACDSAALFRSCLDEALGNRTPEQPIRECETSCAVSPWERTDPLQLAGASAGDES